MTTRLYISNDTSARAAGADRLAEAWEHDALVELVRTSSRGAFFLEPLVERDGPDGRLAWPLARREDLARILAGQGGVAIGKSPFLAQQHRITFANFGQAAPLSLTDFRAHGGWSGLQRALSLDPQGIIDELTISRLRGLGGAAFPVWRKWQ
ncbi:MAG: formate dehydrogenase, partial [Nitrospirae bacterium]|nr:formate dehydrogenase [Nitrospirota bacterium]